jgi:chromosome partitioning protein
LSKIIAIANQKGGVGKTTTAVNLAASLALSGEKILLVDTDPQGNSSSGLGIEVEKGLYDVYSRGKGIKDAIRQTVVDNLFIVPSSVDLLAVELELIDRHDREKVLLQSLMTVRDEYRYMLVDCPPSLGLLTLNALVAADSVMVPMQCEYYALEGLGKLTRTLKLIRGSYNPELEIEGILLTMYDSRNTLSKQVEAEIKRHFPDKVYKTIIPRNVSLAEAPSHGLPALLYDVRSRGAQSYLGLAKEILNENGVGQRA